MTTLTVCLWNYDRGGKLPLKFMKIEKLTLNHENSGVQRTASNGEENVIARLRMKMKQTRVSCQDERKMSLIIQNG